MEDSKASPVYDLIGAVALSMLLPIIARPGTPSLLRVTFGVLYLAIVPGYALTAAVFPGRDQLGFLERVGLCLMMSVALVSLIGFVLDFTPWGISLGSLLTALVSLVLACSAVAYWQRARRSPADCFVRSVRIARLPWRNVLLFGSLIVVAVAATVYAAFVPGPRETFTEFYVLGLDGEMGEYHRILEREQQVGAQLVVINHERETVLYRIEMEKNGDRIQIAEEQLDPGETWTLSHTWTPKESGEVDLLLYRNTDPMPYRSVQLRLTVGAG
jgi:uncharacterized membrane protein